MSNERRTPREADLSKVRTIPVATRPNKVNTEEFAKAPGKDRSFAAFLSSLPDVLRAQVRRMLTEALTKVVLLRVTRTGR